MVDEDRIRTDLLRRITSRRASVQAHLREQRPRFRRRANLTIVLSTLAAVATAGPAVGGESFAGGVQQALGLASDSYVWRVLCLVAMLVSVGAAILTNLNKSHDQATRLATLEAVEGELEGLAVLLEFGQLSVPDAVKLYHQYTSKIASVPDPGTPADDRPRVATAAAPAESALAADEPSLATGVPAVPPPSGPGHRRETRARPYPGPPPPR